MVVRPLRLVLVDDHEMVRTGLKAMLAGFDVRVVGEAADADGGVRATVDLNPDIVVTDVRMPPTHQDEGLKAAVELRARHPHMAILVLSQYVEERYATELLVGDSRGLGYLLKDRVAEVGEFVDAVERVGNGGTALDPDVVTQLLARSRRADPLAALTPREREVLQLMAEGRSNTAIAQALVVSEGAVEKHTSSIFAKLGLAPTDAGHRRVLAVLRYLEG